MDIFKIKYLILKKMFLVAEKQCVKILQKRVQPQYSAIIYSYLAVAQLGLEKIDDSIDSSSFAISLDKYNYAGWEALTKGLIAKKNWTEAIRTLEKMISMEPNCSDWLEDLGMCHANIKDYVIAKKYLLLSLSFDPFDYIAWNTLGDIYQQLNAVNDAEQAYKNALKYRSTV